MQKKKSKRPVNLKAELVELHAAAEYFERTSCNYYNLDPVSKRKLLEKYKEDHSCFIYST